MNSVFKPESLQRMKKAQLKTDLEYAVENDDVEAFKALVGKGYTYEIMLKERGVVRGDEVYRRSLGYALMWLYERMSFYCHMFANIVRIESLKVPTMGVRIHQAAIEFMYNPDFMALNSPQANSLALCHEMIHIINGHTILRHKLPEKVLSSWAYTTSLELAVNSLVQGIVDKVPFTIVPSDLKPMDNGQNVPERKSWEFYYNLLKESEPPPPMIMTLVASGQENGEGEGGGGQGDEEGDEQQQDGGGGDDGDEQQQGHGMSVGQLDDHGGWDENETDHPDIQQTVVKQVVAEAVRKAEASKTKMRGYMPGELMSKIDELLKQRSVPFERIFRSFVGSQIKVGRRPTIMKLSRRRQVPPGNVFTRALRIIWYQDDSGSMGPEEVALCRSELFHANQIAGVKILFQRFCYGLVGDMVDLEYADFSSCLTRATGGTDFDAVIEHANEHRPDLVIIATDGEAPTPDKKPTCPMAWVLTSDGSSHPWGAIIRLPTVNEIKQGYKAVIERWAPRA